MDRKRVVVTGLGVISPLGIGWKEFWNNLIAGKSGIGLIDRFDTEHFPTKIAAEVRQFNPTDFLSKREAHRMDRFVQFACAASRLAVEDAKLVIDEQNRDRVGVWIGSGIGGLESYDTQFRNLINKGANFVSPFFIPMMIPDMAAGQVSIMLGARGPNGCTVTACATATNSIGDAFKVIQRGSADVMICGGAEATITQMGVAGFCSMKALSTRNDAPEAASRPFDADRDGFVMGEGSGIVVLEELEYALRRGAPIYGELAGYGSTGDAYHMVQPEPGGDGAARAFEMALQDAGVAPEEVDYINAHGTSTKINDVMETRAIKRVFGEHARTLVVSSTKSMHGHMLGATGAVELIASLLACREDLVPPTINYTTPDPDCDLDYVPNVARKRKVEVALSDSLGFGGHNAVLLVKKYSR